MRVFLMGISLAAACSVCSIAQEKKSPERPPDLSLTATGRQHHAIHTRSKEAQDYFDQGITLIYGFNHEEAERAFQRAGELDPSSAMPLWGIALAVGPNYNADVDAARETLANDTLRKARTLAEHSPEAERDYVAALSARFSGETNPDYKKLSREYVAKMKALSEKYPDDLDAATLYAESLMDLNPWKLWTLDGKPAENTEEIVRILESVLRRDPNHVGANHFYIHAVEASPHPERALSSAYRLQTAVPQAGHLVHMPSHIYAQRDFTKMRSRATRKQRESIECMRKKRNKRAASMTSCITAIMSTSSLLLLPWRDGMPKRERQRTRLPTGSCRTRHRCQCLMPLSSCRFGLTCASPNGTRFSRDRSPQKRFPELTYSGAIRVCSRSPQKETVKKLQRSVNSSPRSRRHSLRKQAWANLTPGESCSGWLLMFWTPDLLWRAAIRTQPSPTGARQWRSRT